MRRSQLSQLFSLRLWTEEDDLEARNVRFKIQHVLSGEAQYARDWAEVAAFVMRVFQEAEKGERQWQSTDPTPC